MHPRLSRVGFFLALALALPVAAAAAPSISVSPSSLDFGSVPIGGFSDQGLLVQNNGPDTLHITSLTITGPGAAHFSIVSPASLPFAIRGFHFDMIVVRFTPSASGLESATLSIGNDDPVRPNVSVPMDGTGFDPAPSIASVRDIPNDQGGRVKLSWNPSPYDTGFSQVVNHYWIFRSVPPLAAGMSVTERTLLAAGFDGGRPAGNRLPLYVTTSAAGTIYWEFIATVQAIHFLPGYSLVVATTSDSTPESNPKTLFMVVALTADNSQYWQSPPDSGYSVDNLAPAAPAPFTGAYSAGATHLHWGANPEADLAGYRVYRGTSADFVPGPGSLIAATSDTGFVDAGPAGGCYKLSAIDIHGNEGFRALLAPGGTVGAPDEVQGALRFAPPRPNPASGEAEFAFWLPAAGPVSLVLYDSQGRRVRDLARGQLPAGQNRMLWNGRDGGGRPVPGGLYFARLQAAGRTLEARLVWLE